MLFYKYVQIPDVAVVRAEQEARLRSLGLSARMRVAPEGINGTVSGSAAAVAEYEAWMESSALFSGIQWKHSRSEAGRDPLGSAIAIKECDEVTATGLMARSMPTALGGEGGKHLAPREFQEVLRAVAEGDDEIVLIDTRNHYETAVGTFRGAVDPKIRNFAQLPQWLEINKERLRGKHVAMVCTGGVRCEKASAYVRSLGVAKEVSQLAGGIHSYLEEFSPAAQASGVRTKRAAPSAPPAPAPGQGAYDAPEERRAKRAVPDTAAELQAGAPEAQAQADEPLRAGEACLFEGINFSFDDRLADPVVGTGSPSFAQSRCLHCGAPCSQIRKDVICVVCKDFVLLCDACVGLFEREDPSAWRKGAPPPAPCPRARAIRCLEHQLLADNWKEYLARLPIESVELRSHVRALRRLHDLTRGRGGDRRRAVLRLQEARLQELLCDRGEPPEAQPDDAACAHDAPDAFVPFVPAFCFAPPAPASRAVQG